MESFGGNAAEVRHTLNAAADKLLHFVVVLEHALLQVILQLGIFDL